MRVPMFALLLILIPALTAPPRAAQSPPAKPCSAPAFHQFDFWVGEWEVHDAAGKLAGHNAIMSEEGGCVLIERWRSAAGVTGTSMNYYDPMTARWRQQWVGGGVLLEMSGLYKDGAMTLEGPLQYLGPDA